VNPRVLNPDPLSILKEANKIYDPSKKPGMSDGFTIIDGDRAKGVGWTSDAAYNDSIKKNFDFTSGDMEAAKAKAARDGVPLVVVVGNKNSVDTKQLVDGVIPGAKGGAQKAVYVYAEMSQLDPNSELGREVAASRGDANHPYTAIFAPKAGADGKPQLENHIANTWGSRAEIGTIIQQQLGHAQTTMDSRKGSYNVPDADKDSKPDGSRGITPDAAPRGSDAAVKPEANEQERLRSKESEAEARVAPHAKTIIDSFKQLKGATYSQREGLYAQAEDAASKLDPKDVALVKQKTSRELETEVAKGAGADQQKVDTLKARQSVLDLMANAPAWTKMNHGISQMHFSQLDQGVAKIKEGAKDNPAYLNSPQFIEQLMRTPYELDQLKEKLPEVKFDDYLKAKKDGTIDQFVAANKPPEVKPEEKPEVQPENKPETTPESKTETTPPATPSETKPELTLVQPEKLKYDGSEYEKALEDAFKSGRRLVGKVGSPDCTGCVDMTAKAWPDDRVQKSLKDKAVFTDINGEQRMDLVDELQANSWPTVVVVEPYQDESGKIKGRVVGKLEPHTAEERGAEKLNGFLNENLTEPKKQLAKPAATETPHAVQPETKPQVPQAEIKPESKPEGPQTEVKPEVTPQPDVRPDVKPEAKPEDSQGQADQATFERLTENHRKILEPLKSLNETSDAAAIEAAFSSAIENAKQVRPEDITRANQLLEAKKQSIIGSITGGEPDDATKTELAKVESNLKMVKRIDQSEAYLNISRGAVRLKMTPDSPEAGKADIKAGLTMHPELANDTAVLSKLKSTGITDAQLKAWFPELPLQGDKPQEVPGTQEVQQAFDRLREQHARNLQPFADLPEQPTEEQVMDAYAKAIESASKVNPVDVQTALSSLETRRQVIVSTTNANGGQITPEAQAELTQINQDAANYSKIGQADGLLYVSMGVRKMTANQQNPEAGIADIHKGLELRPALCKEPSIMAKLASTGFDSAKLNAWFPELSQTQAPGPQPGPQGPQEQNVPPRPGSRR